MFTAIVNGRELRWAFMPAYLNTLTFSASELRERRGWRLTRKAILEMQKLAHSFEAEFIVMFLPFKSQVYWPTLERKVSPEALASAVGFYLGANHGPFNIQAMARNRLAQNGLLREVCEQAAIPFVDTTDALQQRFEAGENVYFPDESHLNELGESVVAEALATFLEQRTPAIVASHRWSALRE
jgi:hypothetical protein